MQYRMNYEIENIHSVLERKDAWIPSEDCSDRFLYGYTLWLGSTIRAYVAGCHDKWTAWVFESDVNFGPKENVCYQYTCKKVLASMQFGNKEDAMSWCETMTRMGD